MLQLVAYGTVAFILSVALTPLCGRAARRLGYVAGPKKDRWHAQPTALFGGVAIAVSVIGPALVSIPLRDIWVLLVGSTLMFGVGLADDILTLKPSTKLVAQIALASLFLSFGYRLTWVQSLTLDTMLTMVWLVGITNAFNLLDNMDGLCAGVALIVGATVLAGLYPDAIRGAEARYIALLLGGVAGFLVYNTNPASIFMGDSGSLFIGLTLAAGTLGARSGAHSQSGVLSIVMAPVLVLLIPIFDTTLVTVSRLLSGRSASQGGRDHTSHRLVAIGLSERSAVAVLWTLAAIAGVTGITVQRTDLAWSGLLAALFVLAMVIFAVYLAPLRVYEETDASLVRAGKITPFVVDFVHKRRVAEVLLDLCLVSISYYAAYRLRFSDAELSRFFSVFLQTLPIVVGIQMLVLFIVGVYRGTWRMFSLMDGVAIAKGVAGGTVAIVVGILYVSRFENTSRGVFIIYAALLMLLMTGSRASFRLMGEFVRRRSAEGQRLIIYGAGERGSLALRELLGDSGQSYRMLGFVDDDPRRHRAHLHGYPVLSGFDGLVSLIRGGAVDTVVISTRLMEVSRLRELEELCTVHRVALARLHVDLELLVGAS